MKASSQTDNETKLFESLIADLEIAEKAGDIEGQESLHDELHSFANSSDSPTIRRAAARVLNREMADMASYRGFLRLIAELEKSGDRAALAQMISDFSEFGRDTSTHPTVRVLVSDAFAKPL